MAELIPPGKAAAICGLHARTLVKHAKAGKIPGAIELLDKVWRFDERELRAWIRRRGALCQARTCTDAGKSGGAASRLTAKTTEEAYEQLLGQKQKNA